MRDVEVTRRRSREILERARREAVRPSPRPGVADIDRQIAEEEGRISAALASVERSRQRRAALLQQREMLSAR
jgi:hypothetical protein